MTKKPRKKKKIESAEIESAESNTESAESTESAQADHQVEAVLPNPVEPEAAAEMSDSEEQPASEESLPVLNDASAADESANVAEEISTDDLLDDVRKSLMEAETLEEEKKSKKWWRRVAKGSKKDKSAEAEKPADVEMNLPAVSAPADFPEEQAVDKQPEEYLDEIDELIGMLETEEAESARQTAAAVEVPSEPEPEIDIEEMKKQAFRPRGEDEQENITEVRSIALEDGEEVFVEVQTTAQDPLEERLAALENVFRPYRRYIYFGLAFMGLIMAVIASVVLFNVYKQNRPQVPTEVSNLPFPTSMSLPGGLNFNLGKGSLQDGQWNPRGPEWLQGTEVCRWVAIPWSRQLEAVIRTLNKDDQIEIVMSNNDRLVYKVYSVSQLSNEELQKLPTDSPCLLLVLAKADSDMRWVLTALP